MGVTADHLAQEQTQDTARPLDVNERCWQVRESSHTSKDNPGMRWVQRVWVVRGDSIAEFRKDMGPTWAYPFAKPFMFVSMNEYSVGESLEQANYLRESQPSDEEPHDLIRDWYMQLDEMRDLKAHRSRIGPWSKIQRN